MKKNFSLLLLLSISLFCACGKDDPLLSSCGDDCVEFGRYISEEDGSPRKIEWLVLDKEDDGTLLLMSKYVLECMPYHEAMKDITWEASNLRKWLNNDFIISSFTHEEQARLIETTNENLDNHGKFTAGDLEHLKEWEADEDFINTISEIMSDDEKNVWNTPGGNETHDRVWLLSLNDIPKYNLNVRELRQAQPLPLLKKRFGDMCSELSACAKNNSEGNYRWWLRSPGITSFTASYIHYDGYIDDDGVNVTAEKIGVRPVIKIMMII